MAKVVYLVTDLLFTSKIRETATQLGHTLERATDPESLRSASVGAAIVLIDLRRPDALAALDALAADATTRAIPTAGFVDHEREDLMDAARTRGCNALAKGKFSSELPRLLAALV
jgi:hypothetical protein